MNTDRIKSMEETFDRVRNAASMLDEALALCRETLGDMDQLLAYYESDAWREDYDADRRGELNETLKRGVLSQDGVYDLLTDLTRLKREMTLLGNRIPG